MIAGVVSIILKALVAWWCYSIAERQGRKAGLAAVLGFFFGLFAVLGYFIAGDKTQEDLEPSKEKIVETTETIETN